MNGKENINTPPLVSVIMITYSHEKYISKAIKGVFSQKSNFLIELIIANDNSPDNTDLKIKSEINKQPKNLKVIYINNPNNLGMHKNFFNALKQAHGKYIAICEGDDYWIDPLKLNKQVGFLENNTDYGLIYTREKILNQETGKIFSNPNKKELPVKGLIYHNTIATLTTLFRKSILDEYIDLFEQHAYTWVAGDYPIWLWIEENHKIYYLAEETAVYRRLPNSASNHKNKRKQFEFREKCFDIALFFAKRRFNTKELQSFLEYRYFRLYWNSIAINLGDKTKKYYLKLKSLEKRKTKIQRVVRFLEITRLSKILTLAYIIRRKIKV